MYAHHDATAQCPQARKTRKELSDATDLLHLAAKNTAKVMSNDGMGSSSLAEAMEHIASVGNILERVSIAQPLVSTELEDVSTSTASAQVPQSFPRQLTERPLGLQRLHKELGAIGYAT